jgi:hypothetical protein
VIRSNAEIARVSLADDMEAYADVIGDGYTVMRYKRLMSEDIACRVGSLGFHERGS